MAVVVIRKVGNSFGSEREIRFFKHTVGFYLLYCLTAALWMPINYGIALSNTTANAVLAIVNLVSIVLVTYFWLRFAWEKLGKEVSKERIVRAASWTPIAVLCALFATNFLTGWMFTFDQQGSLVQGPLFGMTAIVSFGYVAITIVGSLMLMRSADSKPQRSEYATFAQFAVLPIAACIIDQVIPNTPVMALGVLAAIIFVFLSLHDARIYNDALTGLNNRRRADLYLADRIASASDEDSLYVFVLDINLFKQINDTRGHVEGDHALQVVANGLRRAAATCKGFVARWGGDEFVLIVDGSKVSSPDTVVDSINECVEQACNKAGIAYSISVTTGYAVCSSSTEDPDSLFSRADRMLYERKQMLPGRMARSMA